MVAPQWATIEPWQGVGFHQLEQVRQAILGAHQGTITEPDAWLLEQGLTRF